MRVRIGTRGSKLALWQAHHVQSLLESAGIDTEIVEISTVGDEVQQVPLYQIGVTGVFTKALDIALLQKDIDIAVHSAKDMPSVEAEGLEIIAAISREDPRDVLLAASPEVQLENFQRKLVVGTSSVRRTAFLKHYFDHVEVQDIRGNVDTRVQKMQDGKYDAILLAYAGVKRMGLTQYVTQKLSTASFTPAVGQGIVAVAARKGWDKKEAIRQPLNDLNAEIALSCERSFLASINGGCHVPAFGFATVVGNSLSLTAGMASPDGKQIERVKLEGSADQPKSLGQEAANKVLPYIQVN